MREPILRAVAMPPRILFAPMVPAMANFVLQMPFMMMWVAFKQNPLVFMFTIAGAHIIIILVSVKDPHLSNMLKSQGPFMKKYTSIYHSAGRKLAP